MESAVLRALQAVIESPEAGISLPEMGDPSIREVHFRMPRPVCRIIYDVEESVVRILWFTDNRTCYRNGKGPVVAVQRQEGAG